MSKNQENTKWYKIPIEKIYSKLKTKYEGLSQNDVKKRQEIFGKNTLPHKKPPTLFEIIIRQFANPLIYILLIAAIFSIFVGDIKDCIFIFIVIAINAAIGTFQEWKAEKSTEALQHLLKIRVKVLRDNKESVIPSEELVPGDIVILESGDKVPADIRLFVTNNMSCDEALLTGESVAVAKEAEDIYEELELADQSNMVFAGSTIMTGRARGIVVSTGEMTEIGKIARAITFVDVSKAPLIQRIEKFTVQIAFIVVISCIVLAFIELHHGSTLKEVFYLAIALAVSSIPEGLPAALSVALSIGMARMSKRNVIVKKLTAVEGLGSCTCIASDKTGTLTVNKQTVKKIILPDEAEFVITGQGYDTNGKIVNNKDQIEYKNDNNTLYELIEASILCNEATYTKKGKQYFFQGDAVDISLLVMGIKAGVSRESIIQNTQTHCEIPFESERGFCAVFYERMNRYLFAIKGAGEIILPKCSKILTNNGTQNINIEKQLNKVKELSAQGYRVIAIAKGETSASKHIEQCKKEDIKDLTFLGFVCLIDPLRPESQIAIEKAKQAGVKTVIITGDHPETAFAIGQELGIVTNRDEVITGREFAKIKKEEFLDYINNIGVYARVTPVQKLDIVNLLIESGHFVAVTGDGVNDAPALKRANIGIAMGSGTEVSKDAASIIIIDDNFASIEAGIEEGRFTYDNIRKVIYLLVSTGFAEITLFLLSLANGLPIPLMATQLLWLNLITNGIQGVALAFEAGEKGAMTRPPRDPKENIFNKLMIKQILISGFVMALLCFMYWDAMLYLHFEPTKARNFVLLLMVLLQNFHVFNSRSEYISAFKIPIKNNPILVYGVILALGIHLICLHIPIMQEVLQVYPVNIWELCILILTASLLLFIMEVFKIINFKKSKKSN